MEVFLVTDNGGNQAVFANRQAAEDWAALFPQGEAVTPVIDKLQVYERASDAPQPV